MMKGAGPCKPEFKPLWVQDSLDFNGDVIDVQHKPTIKPLGESADTGRTFQHNSLTMLGHA